MSSQHVRPLLSDYIDGEATPAERRQVDEHLVRCADCAAVLAEYRAIGSNVRAMPRPMPPPTLHRDVWTAIEASRGRSTWGTNLAGLLRWGALGATALAAIIIVVLVLPKTPAAGVQMTRPVDGQTNVGINSPVILQFTSPVTEFAKAQVRVSTNVPADTVYARWLITGTELELGPSYSATLTPGPDTPPPAWPVQSVITISVVGPVYAADGNTVVINGGDVRQFSFQTGTLLEPTDTATPVPTDTPTPEPPTDTPVPPTLAPSETPFVPPQPTETTPPQPTQPPPPPVIETATPASEPPTRQPTVPAPPTVTTPPNEPTKEPTPLPPSLTPIPPPIPTPPSLTPIPLSATPLPTNTPVLPTATVTPVPTPVLPSPEVTVTEVSPFPTEVPTETPKPGGAVSTPSLTSLSGTPRVGTPTPATTPSVVAGCPAAPQHGFGQVYNDPDHAALRATLGCSTGTEAGFVSAAEQNFEHGYMFWNGDDNKIYVFSTVTSTWHSYTDTWVDGEPPSVVLTPPAGYFQPVRGFGKIWVDNPEVRQELGWATGQEHGVEAAWQTFTHGAMLWTNSHIIRVLYERGGWELYYDTYTGP